MQITVESGVRNQEGDFMMHRVRVNVCHESLRTEVAGAQKKSTRKPHPLPTSSPTEEAATSQRTKTVNSIPRETIRHTLE